jgi:integrase
MNLTLKHAAAPGLKFDLQATMKVRALLGKRRHEAQHIPSLPYADAPSFNKSLCERDLMSCYALRFRMLTVARSGEARFATYAEIDNDVSMIPTARTKTGRENRVSLTDEALQVIKAARQSKKQTFLFPSPTGKPISDATMSKFMKDNDYEARPHGFRATFRTWAENKTEAAWEDKEAALGHQVDG